jgi:hypothetical protein
VKERGVTIKVSSRRSRHINGKTEIVGCKLLFVEYIAGSGKYSSKNRARWAHQIPAKIPAPPNGTAPTEWWPTIALSFTKSTQLELETTMMCQEQDVDMTSDGHEEIQYDPEDALDTVVETAADAGSEATPTVSCVYVTCKEQLKEPLPAAWPIPLRSRI